MTHTPPDMQAPRGEVPTYTQRVLIAVAIAGIALAAGYLLVTVLDLLLLMVAGILFAVFLNGLSRWLSARSKFSYGWSLAIVVVVLLGGFGIGLAILIPQINQQVTQLFEQLSPSLNNLQKQLMNYPWAQQLLAGAPRLKELTSGQGDLISQMISALSSAFGFVANAVIIFFVGLYLAADPATYREGIAKLFPLAQRDRAREVLNDMGQALLGWLTGQLIAMAIIGVCTAVGLSLMGIPLPIALAVLTALLTFIPNIGPIVSVVPPALLALQQGPWMALYVVLFFLALQTVESYLVTPLIQQREVLIPPVLTIFAQLFMGVTTGILGVAMATPLTAALLVLVKELYVGDVLGDRRTAAAALKD